MAPAAADPEVTDMTTSPEGPASDQAGPARGLAAGFPDDPDGGDDVDVLYLAGQRPADAGDWLLITAADGLPGAEFTARVLPPAGRQAHGGDVLVHLAPEPAAGPLDLPAVRVGSWAVIDGLLIPVAAWERQDLDGWPERIRATVAFAMSVLTELEDYGAELGPAQVVDLDNAGAAAAGIPAGVTFGTAGPRRRQRR
jgi:hypothetical protein